MCEANVFKDRTRGVGEVIYIWQYSRGCSYTMLHMYCTRTQQITVACLGNLTPGRTEFVMYSASPCKMKYKLDAVNFWPGAKYPNYIFLSKWKKGEGGYLENSKLLTLNEIEFVE